jgi:hypothetical protein
MRHAQGLKFGWCTRRKILNLPEGDGAAKGQGSRVCIRFPYRALASREYKITAVYQVIQMKLFRGRKARGRAAGEQLSVP